MGFQFFGKRHSAVEPAPAAYPRVASSSSEVSTLPDLRVSGDVRLVSIEDIYSEASQVLLLSAGQCVRVSQLPALIKQGVRPEQFRLDSRDVLDANVPNSAQHSVNGSVPASHKPLNNTAGMSNPIYAEQPTADMNTAQFLMASRRDIVVMDDTDKSLKRMVDCLVSCGIPIHKVHPVMVAEYLDWAIQKYEPQVLFLPYELTDDFTPHHFSAHIRPYDAIETLILMVRPKTLNERINQQFAEVTSSMGVHVLYKPVTRFMLRDFLKQTAEATA